VARSQDIPSRCTRPDSASCRLNAWISPDDNYGTTIYNIRFDNAATVYESVLKVLPDADAWGDDNEEMYHAVTFQVTSNNGVVSAWTSWENSPVVSFHL
jgi:hypothetical protein